MVGDSSLLQHVPCWAWQACLAYTENDLSVGVCSAASSDLLDKTQTAQKLLKVVIAGLSEDAQSEEVRKVWVLLESATLEHCSFVWVCRHHQQQLPGLAETIVQCN